VTEVTEMAGIPKLAERINARAGSSFVQVRVSAAETVKALPPRDGVYVKNRFREALGFQPM
jgi:hypothetical protein